MLTSGNKDVTAEFTSAGETILRAPLFHTPRDPFVHANGLESEDDGALAVWDGKILACGEYDAVRHKHPTARVEDLRDGFLLPGLVDAHVHFPQLRVLGGMGRQLLDWLDDCALPEEALMADVVHAERIAKAFIRALSSHGTTTALVFGAHFAPATAALFDVAAEYGIRIVAGMVLSDRRLRPELLQTPDDAYRASTDLIRRYHGRGRLLYAITPRFALSTSEAMLEVCQTLLKEHPDLRFQTHMNENALEIATVAQLFPGASDYVDVYDRFGLCRPLSVIAHNVHPKSREIERLAETRTAIAHCPSSNCALGSGLFPMRGHIEAGVRVALGTDVGGGIGFGMLKEALQAYLVQRIAPQGWPLTASQLLYLVTLAGAEAIGLQDTIGDFRPGKSADFVYLQPAEEGVLRYALERASSPENRLSVLLTLAGQQDVRQVCVEGCVVYPRSK